jgi:hypothetical protein
MGSARALACGGAAPSPTTLVRFNASLFVTVRHERSDRRGAGRYTRGGVCSPIPTENCHRLTPTRLAVRRTSECGSRTSPHTRIWPVRTPHFLSQKTQILSGDFARPHSGNPPRFPQRNSCPLGDWVMGATGTKRSRVPPLECRFSLVASDVAPPGVSSRHSFCLTDNCQPL